MPILKVQLFISYLEEKYGPGDYASGGIATTWNNKDAKQAGHVAVTSNKIIHKKILGLLKPIV